MKSEGLRVEVSLGEGSRHVSGEVVEVLVQESCCDTDRSIPTETGGFVEELGEVVVIGDYAEGRSCQDGDEE